MNFQQSIHQFFQDFKNSQDVKRIAAKLDYKTYFEKFKTAAMLSFVAHFIFSAFSIITGVSYVALKLGEISPALGFVFGGLVLLVIEAFKSLIWGNLFKSNYESLALSDKVNIGFIGLLSGLALLGVSVFLSIEGAKLGAQKLADKGIEIQAAAAVNVDSVARVFDSKIEKLETSISEIEKHKAKRWGGLLSASENSQILNLQNRIASFEAEKAASIERLGQSEAIALTDNQNAAQDAGSVLFALSAFNELLIIVCMWFPWYYAYRVRSERDAITGGQTLDYANAVMSMLAQNFGFSGGMVGGGSLIEASTEKPQIGFKSGGKNSEETKHEPRTCQHENCENDISHRSHLAKYCSDECRGAAWESRTGKKFIAGQKR